MKDSLYLQLGEIQDPEIKSFVRIALDSVNEEFWHIPCSGTGKFHPPENQGEAGLIRHLIKSVIVAKDLCRYFNIENLDRDIVIASTILHDIKKFGEEGQMTHPNHGKLGADFLQQFQLREPIKSEILKGVRFHCGRFVGNELDLEPASNPNKKQLIVQMADLFSSRRYASWLPGVNVNDRDIGAFL